MYLVKQLFDQHGKSLDLHNVNAFSQMEQKIKMPEVHRPGLALAGYKKSIATARILVFGKVELAYIQELEEKERLQRLKKVITKVTPAVIIARGYRPSNAIINLCEELHIPLFRSKLSATTLVTKITLILTEEFAPSITLHGTLLEVFGVGILIQGESSVGKSEAALGLLERGHRLISDDVVMIKKREGAYLIGSGPELTRHLMEIRGIGIINVAHLYGAICVRHDKGLDLVIQLEEWDDKHFYDRVGLEEKYIDILGVSLPHNILPVKPGRDVVLLIETIALNHRLKKMGYHSAKEFNAKLLEVMARKSRKKDEMHSYA